MSQLVFPAELRAPDKSYPYMTIRVVDGTNKDDSVAMYLPPGIAFQDGAGYNTMNLGAIGGAVLRGSLKDPMQFAQDSMSAAVDGVKRMGGGSMKGLMGAGLAALAADFVPGASFSSAKEVFSFANKKIVNPHTNVSFTGSAIRNYQFQLKLMPETVSESYTINKMVKFFRENMYPEEENDVILKYPSRFEILFWSGGDTSVSESDHLPKIYQCYLTALNTVYNPTSNLYLEDGSPAEVDLSISFQETRALSRNDIKMLEQSKIRSFADRDNYNAGTFGD